MPGRKCEPGCTCGRHDKGPCPEGCTCWRHVSRPRPSHKPDCKCPWCGTGGCQDGCTCWRHDRKRVFDPHNPDEDQFREFFLYWTAPPYLCEYCYDVVEHTGNQTCANSLVVHHIDHDYSNITLENLMPLHRKCHPSVHITGMKRTEEQRKNISIGIKRSWDEGRRQPIASFTFRGRVHSDEAKRLVGESSRQRAQQRVMCYDCNEWFPITAIPLHKKITHEGKSKFNSAAARKRASDAATKNFAETYKWCDECQRSYSKLTWPRHIRKYHEGGEW